MSYKTENKSLFTRVYKRTSKSPFDDHGTILWLACLIDKTEKEITLNYERYIYLHREASGVICGISVSEQMLAESPEFEERYLYGIDMYAFLLLHIEEICEFCELFSEEFIEVYLMPPLEYFSVAEEYWLERVSNA